MRITTVLTVFALLLSWCITEEARSETAKIADCYDVVIYGGTCAAVTAAVQTAQMGKTVVIVSPDDHLGGLSSGGLGATDSGNRSVIGGLSREFYHRIWLHYQDPKSWTCQPMPVKNGIPGQGGRGIDNDTKTMWVFEPHIAESIFEGFVKQYNIPVFRGQWLDREKGVKKEGARIKSITTLAGKTFNGKMFIDTTYEGDLMAAAGVSYTFGREANSQYNETLNGIQTKRATYHQFNGFVDPYIVPGKPESGLLPFVQPKINGADGQGDKNIQAYNLRLCLTSDPNNQIPFTKPEGYDPLQYELCLRSLEAGQKDFFSTSPMPNFKTDSNNNNAFSTDMIGGNYEYPEGSYAKRREIYQAHVRWCQGLLWTLVSNPRVPEDIRNNVARWGLSKDEFAWSGHYPHQLYVREARRMVSDFVVTERHLRRLTDTPHPVGMGSYGMDSHHTQRYVDFDLYGKASVRNEGDVEVGTGGPYPIDYGAIVPKKNQCENLAVPVCVSCTHIAFGSIRMEPVFMLLGQSAATAAVLSLEKEVALQDLDYATLKKRLLADKQILETDYVRRAFPVSLLKGIVQDSQDAKIVGQWKEAQGIGRYIENGYLHDMNEEKGKKSVVFTVKVPKTGTYECRVSYSNHANRATNVPVTIRSDKETKTATINEKLVPPIDELFISVGTIKADKEIVVTIENKGTNGHVIADGVQILPVQDAK
ncbi:MAG: FAD-dependent oxidoreductase [Planctomycetia bacterium]|nr:FAD-dependent oxidoreductase [Planctomycetia bacterium]